MIGETISHYKIVEKIGEGGMGIVYKAEDSKLKRNVVLKFLPREFIRDEEARQRFKLEAQAAAGLNNPNIVTIHEIDEHEGQIYIAMEYVEGQTLREKIADSPVSQDTQKLINAGQRRLMPLEIETVVDITIQVCKGLAAAHKAGIVHRDIKPQNIIINNEGVVKILDFGVAKLTHGTNLTKEFSTVGTPHYICPEHLISQQVDQRSDIWALGVVIYEMLTAELPFYAENVQSILYSIVNEDPIPPSDLCDDISRDLERVTLKCLRKKPEERYQNVEDLLADMNKISRSLTTDSQELKIKRKEELRKETERRHATLIAAEITGYNEMLSLMDPEEVASVTSQMMDNFNAISEKYGGRIDKSTGNSFMVLFGVPLAIEHAPTKAIETALEMRSQMDRFVQDKIKSKKIPTGVTCGLRLSINSGVVIAGVMGKDEQKYSVIGDTVNLANQLRDTADPGQILVGPLTHKYTKSDYEYRIQKPLAFHGRKYPVQYYELLVAKEEQEPRRLGSQRMIFSQLVGREKELNRLQLQLMKVINNEGSIVNISGEAGIGKTRLFSEFRKNESLGKVVLLEGRALSIGKNLSFHPIVDLLKNWSGIGEKDTPQVAYNKLEKTVKNILPEAAGEVFPFIATMMGMPLSGEHADRVKGIEGDALEKLTRKNFRDLVVAAASKHPLIIVLDDLQWSDNSSIELLESLMRLAGKHPIMFINIFRSNYAETSERLVTTIKERCRKFHIDIPLEALDRNQARNLITNLLDVKDMPTSIMDIITTKAGGNPYFIEEVMRSFIDDGVVELKDGKFKVTEKIDSVVIPGTINDVLMGRIDRLHEETRALLKIASVIGRNFLYKLLVYVSGDIDDIDRRLDYLQEVQLIQERSGKTEREYCFTNTLIQEAAYESILVKKRKDIHEKVAAAIEEIFADRLSDFYGMLAMHYNQAEELEKAEIYLTKAGEEALKAAASSEALNYYREALNLYRRKAKDSVDPAKIAELEKNIAVALYNKGQFFEAIQYFDKVLVAWGEKPAKGKGGTMFNLATSLSSIVKNLYAGSSKKKQPGPRINEVVDITHKRATALASIDNYRMFVDSVGLLRKLNKIDISHVEKGPAMYIQGCTLFAFSGLSFTIAEKLLEYPREYIESGSERSFIDYKFAHLVFSVASGKWSQELQYNSRVVATCIKLGEVWTAISYLLWNGKYLVETGDFAGAEKNIEKLKEIAEVFEHDQAWNFRNYLVPRFYLKQLRFAEAEKAADDGIAFAGGIGQHLSNMNILGIKATAQIYRGDLEGAGKSLQQAQEIAARETRIAPWHNSSLHFSNFLYDVTQLEQAIQEDDRAKVKEFSKLANNSSMSVLKTSTRYAPLLVPAYRLNGTYNWLIGKQKEALEWWGKSITTGQRLKALPELAQTYTEVARRLKAEDSKFQDLLGVTADEYQREAETLMRKLGISQK